MVAAAPPRRARHARGACRWDPRRAGRREHPRARSPRAGVCRRASARRAAASTSPPHRDMRNVNLDPCPPAGGGSRAAVHKERRAARARLDPAAADIADHPG